MEWISFSLDNEQKTKFETQLLPALCKQHGFLLEMSGLTWAAYTEKTGLDTYRYLFCSDSTLFLKFIKEFVEDHTRIFSVPDVLKLEYFGPENLLY